MTPFLVPPKNVDFLLRRQPDGRTIRQLKSVALDIPRMVLRLVKDVCHNHEVLTHRVQRYVAQDGHWTVASRGNLGNSTKAIKAGVLAQEFCLSLELVDKVTRRLRAGQVNSQVPHYLLKVMLRAW